MIKKVSFFIRDYFGFSRTETRGVFLLLFLVCLAIFATIYFEKTAFATYQEREADLILLDSLMLALERVQTSNTSEEKITERKMFAFDPNHASLEDFLLLGIHEKMANRILNYRNKGGKFYKAEDMLRIYGFPPALYEDLQPHIHISRQQNKKPADIHATKAYKTLDEKETITSVKVEKEVVRLDLNEADSLQLSTLRGIGPVLSSRIVKYRNQLGGFHTKAQLKEIYKISDLALESLEEYAYISDHFEPQYIKINEVDFKTLLKHPYIDYELAKSIMNHRRIYGNFSSPEQLREVYQMKEELLVKLLPYIVI